MPSEVTLETLPRTEGTPTPAVPETNNNDAAPLPMDTPIPDATPSIEPPATPAEPNRFNPPMVDPTTSVSPSGNPLRGGGSPGLRRDNKVQPAGHAIGTGTDAYFRGQE
jgi:hypothetical protein